MYCRSCRYELTGIAAGEDPPCCPECGRAFDPANPRSVASTAEQPFFSTLNPRVAAVVILAGLVVLAITRSWLPRPVTDPLRSNGWRLWEWFNQPYGVEVVDSASGGTTQHEVHVRWWAGDIRRVTAVSDAADTRGVLIWSLRRDTDSWTLDMPRPDLTDCSRLIYFFNTLRSDDELFGIRILDMGVQPAAESVRVEGDQTEVFSLMVNTFGITLEPMESTGGQVWAWDPEDRQLVRMSTSEWAASGETVPGIINWSARRQTPRHSWAR